MEITVKTIEELQKVFDSNVMEIPINGVGIRKILYADNVWAMILAALRIGSITQRLVNVNPDSIEIGTPGKGGVIKVYGSYAEEAAFLEKIRAAQRVRDEANRILGGAA